jgi:hypothetical protein
MVYCGVVEVRSLEDALGATCGRKATTLCSDCGVSLCAAHAERCHLCREAFCPSCLSFHSVHLKPSAAAHSAGEKRKSA